MKPIQFAYFLQGFAEVNETTPTEAQWKKICAALKKVKETDTGQASHFITWLTGFVEISQTKKLTAKQWTIVKDHLQLCFTKVTPDRSKKEAKDDLKEMDKILDDIMKRKDEIKPWRERLPFPDVKCSIDPAMTLPLC